MQIAIIDDVKTDREILSAFLERYCAQHHMDVQVSVFKSGEEFLSVFSHTTFDVVFLDVYMNGMDGLQVAQEIRGFERQTLLVFATGSEQHAVKSYRVRALDYLVKPYNYEQFSETMHLCEKSLLNRARHIVVKEGRVQIKILLSDILYVDYSNHYVLLHTKERIIKSYMPFGELADKLQGYPQFLACYRNCIINMDEVSCMEERDFLLGNGERLPISRAQLGSIRQRYADYEFERLERRGRA